MSFSFKTTVRTATKKNASKQVCYHIYHLANIICLQSNHDLFVCLSTWAAGSSLGEHTLRNTSPIVIARKLPFFIL